MGWCFRRCPPSFSTASHADTRLSWQIARLHRHQRKQELQRYVDPTPAAFKCEDYSEGRLQNNNDYFKEIPTSSQNNISSLDSLAFRRVEATHVGQEMIMPKIARSHKSHKSQFHSALQRLQFHREWGEFSWRKSEIWSFWSFCSM